MNSFGKNDFLNGLERINNVLEVLTVSKTRLHILNVSEHYKKAFDLIFNSNVYTKIYTTFLLTKE